METGYISVYIGALCVPQLAAGWRKFLFEEVEEFAGKVKALNDQYFIEIQGHTDDVGGRKYNDELGQRRADEVRRFLSRTGTLPLNRMSTISYGDTLPVAPNKTKKGRAENRRVVLVVLE